MTVALLWVATVAAAYLIGSIPTGVMVARARGIDIRAVGSGNIGATNVTRILGGRLGLIVLACDAAKGAGPMLAALALALPDRLDPYVVTAVGLAAIGGHCFSVWLGFRGGKGVATTLGVFAVVAPLAIGLAVCAFAAVYAASRVVSLSSLAAAVALPALLYAFAYPHPTVALGVSVAVLIFAQHRANIGRLIRREESGLR